ncbi:MAG: glycerophosphodiester phosphodiesterase [Promethearchaeota archaeon]
MKSEFLYVGHRGTRTHFDENTINAFEKAIEYGANCIEFDVRRTKDNKLVILHDPKLDRTTNSSGLLKDLYYSEIKNISTKNHKNTIPLLSEVLNLLKGKTLFMIELKDDNIKEEVLSIVKNYNLLEDCIFSGRNLNELGEIKKVYHNSRICYNLTKGLDFDISEFLKFDSPTKFKIKPDFISLRSNLTSKKFIEICHDYKIKALAWDFIHYKDPIFEIKWLIDMGINGILFDNHANITTIKSWVASA